MKKEKSITKNSAYYLLYQVFNMVFPFITGIYVARVLLPEAVGMVAYAQNIAAYFSLMAFLGIPTYGMREISKVREDKHELSKVYSELLIINFISTCFFSFSYLVLIFLVPQFRDHLILYMVTGSSILLNMMNNSWLYEGFEEFRFISIRNIFFKTLCFFLLVVLVRTKDDYLLYAFITVLGSAGNNLINMIYAPKFVKFTTKGLKFKKHLKPVFTFVAVNLAIELYSLVDVTMLGAMKTNKDVAYYSYANRIQKILIQVLNSFTIVVVPRFVSYYKKNKLDQFNSLLSNTLEIILVLAIPMVFGIQVVAKEAIVFLYGEAFLPSADVLRVLVCLLVVSPVGYLLGSRVLLVTNNENKMAIVVWIGAILNIVGNAVLIPVLSQNGAALASLLSELCVMGLYVRLGSKYFTLNIRGLDIVKIISAALIMSGICWFVGLCISSLTVRLIIQACLGVLVYFSILIVTKEQITTFYFKRLILSKLH